MKICGLTGGVGMGKTTAAGFLLERGACVIDTDVIARDLVRPGQEALLRICDVFGSRMLDGAGNLRRGELARIVFADPDARKKLELILHPAIRNQWRLLVDLCRKERKKIAVVVIPLLFEIGSESEFDFTICVACSAKTQQERLSKRGWTDDHIRQRLAAQWPVEMKMAKADYVVWNDSGEDIAAEQLRRILPEPLI